MQVHILGNTPQIRGLQLEKLTELILESKGYKNLIKRQISSGGHELDIAGELQVPMVGRDQTIVVICECKAHAKPIGTTDWLKFLGKVYLEEVNSNGQVNGCFISLNGVNGNVSGSYKQLKEKKKDNIELVSGDDLFKALLDLFPSTDHQRNGALIAQQTRRKVTNLSLAYYESRLYWVFSFEGDVYTALNETGDSIEEDSDIASLLKESVSGEYIDLKLEKERLDNERNTESKIYTALAASNGTAEKSALLDTTKKIFEKSKQEFSDDIYRTVLEIIDEQPFIEFEGSDITFDVIDIKNRVLFFKRVFGVGVSPDLLTSDFYKELIDEELIDEIENIQCGVEVRKESRDMCLKTLFLSPSALSLSVNEIQIITNHRKNQPKGTAQLDDHDSNLYLRMIVEKFMEDYENPMLTTFFFSHVGIEELDFSFDIKLKTKAGIFMEHENRRRLGIGQMSEEYGGQLIRILSLNDAPEPWERYGEENG